MYKLLFTSEFSLGQDSKRNKFKNDLENYIIELNNGLLNGQISVSDRTYDNCMDLLQLVYPESVLLKNDKSIKIIKSFDEDNVDFLYSKIKDYSDLRFFYNPEGLNLRLYYKYGELVKGESFGRTFHKKDLTDLAIRILSNRNENLEDLENVEIEGTIVLMKDQLDFLNEISSAKDEYEGLFALLSYDELNEGAIENLEDLLTFVATDIFIDGLPLTTIEEKYSFLQENLAFETPDIHSLVGFDGENMNDYEFVINNYIDTLRLEKEGIPYQTNGVRLFIEDGSIVIFRLDSFERDTFDGIVSSVEWEDILGEKLPILKFERPVRVEDNIKLSELHLDNIVFLLLLNIQEGKKVNFAYFGDFGVLPLTEKGNILLSI